jgi:hypothetical protein
MCASQWKAAGWLLCFCLLLGADGGVLLLLCTLRLLLLLVVCLFCGCGGCAVHVAGVLCTCCWLLVCFSRVFSGGREIFIVFRFQNTYTTIGLHEPLEHERVRLNKCPAFLRGRSKPTIYKK